MKFTLFSCLPQTTPPIWHCPYSCIKNSQMHTFSNLSLGYINGIKPVCNKFGTLRIIRSTDSGIISKISVGSFKNGCGKFPPFIPERTFQLASARRDVAAPECPDTAPAGVEGDGRRECSRVRPRSRIPTATDRSRRAPVQRSRRRGPRTRIGGSSSSGLPDRTQAHCSVGFQDNEYREDCSSPIYCKLRKPRIGEGPHPASKHEKMSPLVLGFLVPSDRPGEAHLSRTHSWRRGRSRWRCSAAGSGGRRWRGSR